MSWIIFNLFYKQLQQGTWLYNVLIMSKLQPEFLNIPFSLILQPLHSFVYFLHPLRLDISLWLTWEMWYLGHIMASILS